MATTTRTRALRLEPIDPTTGTLLRGRRAGRRADTLCGRRRQLEISANGELAVIFDPRHWEFIEDPYNFHAPRSSDGGRITGSYAVNGGWLVPSAN